MFIRESNEGRSTDTFKKLKFNQRHVTGTSGKQFPSVYLNYLTTELISVCLGCIHQSFHLPGEFPARLFTASQCRDIGSCFCCSSYCRWKSLEQSLWCAFYARACVHKSILSSLVSQTLLMIIRDSVTIFVDYTIFYTNKDFILKYIRFVLNIELQQQRVVLR